MMAQGGLDYRRILGDSALGASMQTVLGSQYNYPK